MNYSAFMRSYRRMGIPHVKMSDRKVMFSVEDITAYLNQHRRVLTSA